MATQAQIEANRSNARKSTGPRTAEGKAASAQNAIKHGLRAKQAVIPGEDPAEFEEHREEMLAELVPAGAVQTMLAERVVHLSWRLKRAERFENEAFDALYLQEAVSGYGRTVRAEMAGAAEDEPHRTAQDLIVGRVVVQDCYGRMVLDRLLTYERRIESSLYKAMRELERLKRLHHLAPPTENGTAQSQTQPQAATPTEEPTPPGQSPARPHPATPAAQPTSEPAPPPSDDTLRQTNPINAGEALSIADCELRIGDSQRDVAQESKGKMPNEANLATAMAHQGDTETTEIDAGTALKSN